MTTRAPIEPLSELLYRLAECGYQSEDPQWILNQLLHEIVHHFQVSSGSISLFNPNSNRLDIEAHFGLPDCCRDFNLPMGVGLTGWVALHHKPARVDDVRTDPRYVKIAESIRSALAVPLVDESSSLGVLTIESDLVGRFSEDDQIRLESVSGFIVRVIGRVWRIVNLKKKCTQLESLVTMVGKLSNRFELEGILLDLTREARRILDCRMCSLYLVKQPGTLDLEVLVDEKGPMLHQEQIKFEESSMGTAAQHQKTLEISNLAHTEEFHFPTLIAEHQLVGMLSTPLVYESRVIGVLNAYTTTPHRFSNTEKGLFRALADIGAFAIENTKLYNRIIDSEDALRSNERLTTLGLLSAEIAHEIRNPLTVIKLLVESLALDLDLDEEKHRDLNVVIEKINDLGEIVCRVLNFGKSQQQIFCRWDLNAIVQDSIQLVRFKLQRNRIRVKFEPGNSIWVNCHKGQIQQVLLNLFINAEEAMSEGGHITIRLQSDPLRHTANIYFTDTGGGIPEEIRDGVFDSFLSGKPTGSGLGLAIVKRILRDHRGDIAIEQTGKKGTTFRFWIPLYAA
jgi:signal transduction histidine kinase